jgi:cobalt-zinc-cadmium efflux system membrane fusion protein
MALTMAMMVAACGAPTPHDADGHAEHDEHEDEHADDEHGFSPEAMQRFGVRLVSVESGTVDLGIELPGEVRPNGDRLAHLSARFPGIVREVRKGVGEPVRAGDTLAVVESDQLARYEIRSAFDGTVVDRHVTLGEVVRPDQAAFIVADLGTVWIDLAVYQEDMAHVSIGRRVRVQAGGGADAEGTVSYVSPIVDQATRTATARVVLPNPDGRWRPGMFVTALVLEPIAVPVVVPRSALHSVDGRTVVFVVHEERFVARPVAVGRLGRTTAEVLTGVAIGDRIAADGSFLVKADLAKGEAEHAH